MTRRRRRTLAQRQADAVHEAWERIEAAEPDISTERLLAMLSNETGLDEADITQLMLEED